MVVRYKKRLRTVIETVIIELKGHEGLQIDLTSEKWGFQWCGEDNRANPGWASLSIINSLERARTFSILDLRVHITFSTFLSPKMPKKGVTPTWRSGTQSLLWNYRETKGQKTDYYNPYTGTHTLCFSRFLLCYAPIPNSQLRSLPNLYFTLYVSIMLAQQTTYYAQRNASILSRLSLFLYLLYEHRNPSKYYCVHTQ